MGTPTIVEFNKLSKYFEFYTPKPYTMNKQFSQVAKFYLVIYKRDAEIHPQNLNKFPKWKNDKFKFNFITVNLFFSIASPKESINIHSEENFRNLHGIKIKKFFSNDKMDFVTKLTNHLRMINNDDIWTNIPERALLIRKGIKYSNEHYNPDLLNSSSLSFESPHKTQEDYLIPISNSAFNVQNNFNSHSPHQSQSSQISQNFQQNITIKYSVIIIFPPENGINIRDYIEVDSSDDEIEIMATYTN